MADAAETPAPETTGWEAPDVVGLLFIIWLVYFIFSRCFGKSSTADRIAGLRTFFSVLDVNGPTATRTQSKADCASL